MAMARAFSGSFWARARRMPRAVVKAQISTGIPKTTQGRAALGVQPLAIPRASKCVGTGSGRDGRIQA